MLTFQNHKELECIVDTLRTNNSIEEIDLGGNNIGTEGAREIAILLRGIFSLIYCSLLLDNKSITNMDLRDNNIQSEGLLSIAISLRDNNTLTNIDLKSNRIGNHGAAGLAQVST